MATGKTKRKVKRKPYPVYPPRDDLRRIAAIKQNTSIARLKIRTVALRLGLSMLEKDPTPLYQEAA